MDESRPWWLWPNLLSLDAPAVAVVWQSFLADAEGVEVPVAATGALALAVWGIYLGDRWLDVRADHHARSDRHLFTARNRRTVAALALLALPAAAIIAGLGLPNRYLEVGGIVALISMGYFAVVHAMSRRATVKGLKEASVGAVFAVGVAIPLIVGTAHPGWQWAWAIVAFGGLCVMNCILISRWEENPARAPSSASVVAAAAVATAASLGAQAAVTIAVLSSLALLVALVLLRGRISTRGLRVLADAVLLSPLVVAGLA